MRRRRLLWVVPGLCLAASPSAAETMPSGRRIAIGGYDPVAYFTDGQPQKGSEAFWFAFDDAVYLFKNADHRATFAADPERYAPQYAGFCAGGVSKGYKVEPDPEAWADPERQALSLPVQGPRAGLQAGRGLHRQGELELAGPEGRAGK